MTEEGTSLPEEIRNRIAEKRREAYEAEIVSLEERIGPELERHLSERREFVENLIVSKEREAAEAREREMAELREFEIQTLGILETELLGRRNLRLKEEEERRNARLEQEKNRETQAQKPGTADVTARADGDGSPGPGDPSQRIGKILKQAHKFLDQGEIELAEKTVTEGLKIDAFNPELINLDAKIREQLQADTFGHPSGTPSEEPVEGKKKPARKKDPAAQPGATGKAPKVPLRFLVIAAVIVTVGLGVIVALKYIPRQLQSRSTIAVLPWTAPEGQDDLRLFASTLPEQVVKLLARASSPVNLLGYATTSNLAAMGGDPVRSLVQLGYSHFVRGQITARDSLYVVRVELIDSTGSILWSEEYQRNRAAIMLVPYEIVHRMGDYVESDSPSPTQTMIEVTNPEAYFLYLEGLQALRFPGGGGVDRAINSFSRSVSLDSTLAPASAGLSTALSLKYASSYAGTGNLLDDAEHSADEAIRLKPGMSDGFLAKARVLIGRGDYAAAMATLDSASRRSPRESLIPYLRGLIQFRSGKGEQAIESLREAYLLDPRNTEILELSAIVHLFNKSFEKAMWYVETAMFFSGDSTAYLIGPLSDVIMLDPTLKLTHSQRVTSACLKRLTDVPDDYYTLYRLARILQATGDIQESNTYFGGLQNLLRAGIRSHPADTRLRMYLGLTLTRVGKYDDAISLGEAALRADPSNPEAKYLLAQIYAMQMFSPTTRTVDGEKKTRCFDILKDAMAQRFMNEQLWNGDLYNVYSQTDIRTLLKPASAETQ